MLFVAAVVVVLALGVAPLARGADSVAPTAEWTVLYRVTSGWGPRSESALFDSQGSARVLARSGHEAFECAAGTVSDDALLAMSAGIDGIPSEMPAGHLYVPDSCADENTHYVSVQTSDGTWAFSYSAMSLCLRGNEPAGWVTELVTEAATIGKAVLGCTAVSNIHESSK